MKTVKCKSFNVYLVNFTEISLLNLVTLPYRATLVPQLWEGVIFAPWWSKSNSADNYFWGLIAHFYVNGI